MNVLSRRVPFAPAWLEHRGFPPGDRGVLLLLQLQLVRWQQMVMWYCRLRVCYVVF